MIVFQSNLCYAWFLKRLFKFLDRNPVYVTEKLNNIKKAYRELSIKKGRTPTIAEIAKYCQEKPEAISSYLKAAQIPSSLDRTVGQDEDSPLGQFLEDKSAQPFELLLEKEMPERIAELFQDLKPQEGKVLVLRYGLNSEPQTYQKIATQFGLSRERIRQKEKEAIAKLKKTWKDKTASYF